MSLLKRKDSDLSNPLAELTPRAITRLAEILSRPPCHGLEKPSPKWLAQQQETIAAIPSRMRLRHRYSLAAFLGMDKPLLPKLCRSHGDLCPELIHWVLRQLQWECATHTDRLRGYRNKFREGCPEEIDTFIDKTSGIATLYLSPDEFKVHYGHGLPDDCRLGPVEPDCPACVVAVVGARAQLLVFLRANMVARSRRGAPRLLPLVDAWIACFGAEDGPVLMAESDALAAELRRIRGIMSGRRSAKKEHEGEKKKGAEKKRTHKSSGHRGGRPAGVKMTKGGVPLPQAKLRRADRKIKRPELRQEVPEVEVEDELYGADGYYEQFFQENDERAEPDLERAAGQSREPVVNRYEFRDSVTGIVEDGPEPDGEPVTRSSQVPAANPYEFHDSAPDVVDGPPGSPREPGAGLYGGPAVNPFDFQDLTVDESSDDDDIDGENHESSSRRGSSPILSPFYARSAVPAPLNLSRDNWVENAASADSGGDATWVTWTVHSEETEAARPASRSAPAVPAVPAEYPSSNIASSSRNTRDKGKRPAPLDIDPVRMYPSSSVYSTDEPLVSPVRSTGTARRVPVQKYPSSGVRSTDEPPVSPADSTDTARRTPHPVSPATTAASSTPTRLNWSRFRDPFANAGEQQVADAPISSLVSPRAPRRVAVAPSDENGAWGRGRSDVVTPDDSVSCTVERRGERARPHRRIADFSNLYREG